MYVNINYCKLELRLSSNTRAKTQLLYQYILGIKAGLTLSSQYDFSRKSIEVHFDDDNKDYPEVIVIIPAGFRETFEELLKMRCGII